MSRSRTRSSGVDQLGQVAGVTACGTVFLTQFRTPADSSHAALVTAFLMADGTAVAGGAALALPPRRSQSSLEEVLCPITRH
jgi:hypothetical protein